MSVAKEKIRLSEAQETLLITLYARVYGLPREIFDDPKAREILASVEYDFARLRVKPGTLVTVCLRAKRLDQYVREFLAEHPEGRVLHLGCGLDSRCIRAGNGQADWYDLDLPDVIELRRKFYEEASHYHMLASSVVDPRWLDAVARDERPTIVVAEGLLMYLDEAQVKNLLLALKALFPGCRMAFDAFSQFTASRVHRNPSLRQTGATIRWGIDDPHAIESWAPGIRLREEWCFDQSDDIPRMKAFYRLMFWVSGRFEAARKAHRILYFDL